MRPYFVRQGDYLSALAHRFGFDADAVWNDPANGALRSARPDREVLSPGDVLYVPDRPAPGVPFRRSATNRYRARTPRVRIRIALTDGARPLANERYIIEGLGAPMERTTDAGGYVDFEVPVDVPSVRLVLPALHTAFPVQIGHLDPIDQASGVRQRLAHLGYYGTNSGAGDTDAADAAAIRAFQREQRLPTTGAMDDDTRAALCEAHGS